MTNEELSNQIQKLSDIVANLAKTMNERFEQIDRRFAQIDRRFEQIDKRFTQIDKRFEQIDERFAQIDKRFEKNDEQFAQIDERFNSIDEQLADIRNDHKTLVDIVKDMDLRMDKGFNELKAEDGKIHAEIASLRLELYHESGSRELVDDTLYGSLDKRLRRLEAKFPDLASSQAVWYLAERQGFEPWVRLLAHTRSRRAPSTTRSPLLRLQFYQKTLEIWIALHSVPD